MLHVFPALLEAKGRRAVVASVWPASKVGPDHFSVSLWSVFNKYNQLLFQLWGVWLPKLILPVKRSVSGVYKAEFSPVRQEPTWQRGISATLTLVTINAQLPLFLQSSLIDSVNHLQHTHNIRYVRYGKGTKQSDDRAVSPARTPGPWVLQVALLGRFKLWLMVFLWESENLFL